MGSNNISDQNINSQMGATGIGLESSFSARIRTRNLEPKGSIENEFGRHSSSVPNIAKHNSGSVELPQINR